MEYIGIQTQINRNNRKSVLLLLSFPLLIFVGVFLILYFTSADYYGNLSASRAFDHFIGTIPFVLIGVGIWFGIAYLGHSSMINIAAGSKTLERRDNMRVYNLTENLCMSVGMPMPMLRVIESPALNAFASGINEKSYCVTLTTGIINSLEDDELEGVIAHELMHIRNKDVRLLIISIIFVGIFSFASQIAFRVFINSSLYGGNRRSNDNNRGNGMLLILVIMIISFIAYFLSIFFKLALSRKREYMADAGAAEMTRKPWALASALRKISGNSNIESVTNQDVKELFIDNTPDPNNRRVNFLSEVGQLFSTHPPIEKRIAVLEQF
ncbi:MAG TPA: M48 family metallopeptidase [Chitinophagaceae bacterium]|nr:M48 family metallopeptidase [Chitinophagaceae bacterium]